MYKKFHILSWVTLILYACSAAAPDVAITSLPTAVSTTTPVPPPVTPLPTLTSTPERSEWNIVWGDEFDGNQLNLQNWTFDVGDHGWGNKEWQTYTDRPENVRVENGMMVIEARLEDLTFGEHPFSSARIKTEGLHAWQYGRIEARIWLPHGQGIWPAFWMLGEDFDQIGWPASGEIDIMEHVGSEPNRIHATIHGPGYSGTHSVGTQLDVPADTLRYDFHVYSIEWQENEIRWLFDENEYFKLTPADVPGEWVFDHPFFIIMNVAVGGAWAGYPDATTVFPQYMFVDYVRVYQRP